MHTTLRMNAYMKSHTRTIRKNEDRLKRVSDILTMTNFIAKNIDRENGTFQRMAIRCDGYHVAGQRKIGPSESESSVLNWRETNQQQNYE